MIGGALKRWERSAKRTALGLLPHGLEGRLRARHAQRQIESFAPRIAEHDYGQWRLKVYLDDVLAADWYDKDWPELPEIATLRQTRLRAGAKVFDLGAHQGVVAMMLAREVGPSGCVLALEPNPHNFAVAVKNRDLNAMSQLEILQTAVSSQSGTVTFNQELNGQLDDGTGAGGRLEVASVSVDGLADRFGMPDVVFIDVEGAECLALAGASRTLAAGADFFIEVHIGWGLEKLGGSLEKILSYFPEQRFTILARTKAQDHFYPLMENTPREHFFLIAQAREVSTG